MRDQDSAVTFLLDLARALHLAYLPARAIEQHVSKAAEAFGLRVEVFTLQSLVLTEVTSGATRRTDFRRLPFNPHWNLRRTAKLIALSREVEEGRLALPAARTELDRIVSMRSAYPEWLVFAAYGVYGAAVAARVGGAWREMIAAFVIGVLAGVIHFGTLRSQQVDLQKSFLAALLGSLVAFGLTWVLPGLDMPRALFGGATLLVPAMVVTLGTHELVTESVESGMARLLYGLLRFMMLGVGIAAAARLWHVFAALPLHAQATPLPEPVVIAIVALGGVALTVCMGGRKQEVAWIVAAVVLAFGTQELTKLLVGGRGSPIISAFVLGVAGALYGRLPDRSPTTVIMPGLLQLAPGFVGTQAILALIGADKAGGDARLFDLFLIALQLVMGLVLAAILLSPSRDRQQKHQTPAAEPHEQTS